MTVQTLSTVYRAIRAGLKGDLGFLTTVVTDDREHLPLGTRSKIGTTLTPPGLAALPTRLATDRLVIEPF